MEEEEEEEEEEQAAEEDHDLLDMLDQEDQLEERLPVTSYPDQDHRHHQADRQQPTLFVHDEEVDDINTPVPNYHHPHHPEVQSTINPIRSRSPSPAPVSHSSTNNAAVRSRSTSPQKSRSPSPSSSPVQQEVSPMTYIVLDIDLENNQKDQLIVTLDGDPLLLAYQFMERNNLADSYFLPLSEYIKDTQMQLLENYRRHLEETEDVISRSHSEEGEKISASHVDDDKDPSLLQLDEIHDDEQQEDKEEEEVLYPDRSMRNNQSSSSPLQQQHYSKEEDEELLLSLSLPISRDSRHSNGKKHQQEKIDIDLSDQKEGEGAESVDISHLLDDLFLVHPPVSAEKDTKSKVQKKVITSPKNKKFEVEVDREHDEFVLEQKPAEKLPAADRKEEEEDEDEENFDLDDLDITLDRSGDLSHEDNDHEEYDDEHHEKKEEMKNDRNEEGYYSDAQDLNEIYNIIKQQQRQIQIQQAKLQDHFAQTDTNPMKKKKNISQLHPVDRYIQEDLLAHSPSIHHPSAHSIQEMSHLAATGTGTNPIKGKKISPTTYRSQYEISRNVHLPFSPHPNQLHSHKQLFPAEEEEGGGGDHDREQPIDQEAEEEDQLSDYHSDNNDIGITDDHALDEDLLAEYENPEEEEVLDYHSDREVEEMKQHLYSPHRHDIVDLSDTGSNANNDQLQEEDQYPFPSEDEDDLLLDQFEEDYLEEDEEEEVVSPIQQQPVVEEKKPTPIRRSSQLLIQSVHPVVQSAAAAPPRSTSPKPSRNNNSNKVTTQNPPTGQQQVLPNKNPSTPSADDFRSLASQQQQQHGQLLGKNQEYNHLLSNLTENINNMEMFSPMSPMSPFPLDKSISNEEIE